MTAPSQLRITRRRLNDLIWEDGDAGDAAVPTVFFCECEREDCYLPVWLTPVEYEEGRRRPGSLALAWSHREAATE